MTFLLSLEQLLRQTVESPGKFAQPVASTAAIISVISHQEIERYGANSLLELLDRSTGIAMTGSFFYLQNVASIDSF
ncbi:MAG: outer membrane cobalamin receptor [Alteromonadaceae bacterium]